MSTRTAQLLSYLFHPLFTPLMGVLLLFAVFPYQFNPDLQRFALVLVCMTTIVFPGVSAYFFLKLGVINSLKMESPHERRYPFIVSCASYILLGQFFWQLPLPMEFSIFAFGAALSSLIALIFLPFAKISIHMLALGGIVGGLLAIGGIYFINVLPVVVVLFLLAGMLGTARLVLHAHKINEVYIGFSTGFLVEFLMVIYGPYFLF